MARKKVVISDKELEPTVLYTIKKKRFGFFRLLFLFAIFIGVVIYLPEISKYVEEYKSGEAELSVDEIIRIFYKDYKKDNSQNRVIADDEENTEIVDKYGISKDTIITNQDIRISNFVFENKVLSFDVTNLKNEGVDLRDKMYFLSIFDSNDNFIKRIKVAEDTFVSNETLNYSYNIDSEDISYFKFNELSTVEYPEFVLSDNNSLVCLKTGEMVAYIYDNDNLKTIRNTVFVNNDNADYNELLDRYKNELAICLLNGVQAQLNEDDTGFTYDVTIDNDSNDVTHLYNKLYYPKDTLVKVIKYEMESRDYTCN